MANGQPRPAFYVAVLLVVLGLVGLALWRYGAIGPKSQTGQFSADELKKMQAGAEAPDTSGITTVKEYNFVAATRLPEVKGISSYKPMADRTVRFAIKETELSRRYGLQPAAWRARAPLPKPCPPTTAPGNRLLLAISPWRRRPTAAGPRTRR